MVESMDDVERNHGDISPTKSNDVKKKEHLATSIEPANFESAIIATGFGKFNIFLLIVILPPAFSQVFETVSTSYVLPVAQCDLNLSLQDKGTLNAISFAGMITSGFIWGYLCDVTGRKRIMIVGYLLDAFFVVMSALSQNFTMLLITKFFGGFIINGPFSAATSYLSEFHGTNYRARVHLVRGIIVSMGQIVLPSLAWAVLPQNINFTLFNYFAIHSWNVFLLICSLAPITSGLIFMFMPESPKFLMSAGRNEEALRVFQMIYKFNSGKSIDSYPIKMLVEETVQHKSITNEHVNSRTTKHAIMEGLHQIKPLFAHPNILKIVHVCFNNLVLMMSINTLKLWLPQLFQAINDYEFLHEGASSGICETLEVFSQKNTTSSEQSTCVVNLNNSSVYIRSIVVGFISILTYIVAGTFINLVGKKRLAIFVALTASICATCIYFARNSDIVLALSSIVLSFGGVCSNILVTITLEIFPTTSRAMALSMHLIFGRIGTIVGNVVFPALLQTGCAPPFLFIAFLSFACACLSMFYPNTENKALT